MYEKRLFLLRVKRRAAGGGFMLRVSVVSIRLRRRGSAAVWRRRCRCSPAGTKGDRTPCMVSCPLLTPRTFLCTATPFGRAAKRGLRGLGSVRRADFGKPYCPEFSLRQPPRITVRGHPVQGGGVPLRKAPLPSSVYPWSTKRPCGPLAFRRATAGSRGLKEDEGELRGG